MISRRPFFRLNRGRYPSARRNSGPDTVVPLIQSAVIPSAGNKLILTWNEGIKPTPAAAFSDFLLNGTAVAINALDSIAGNSVTLGLNGAVQSSETGLSVDYTAGANPIKDLAGNNAANLNDYPVTNNSTQGAGATPSVLGIVVDSSGTFADTTFDMNMDQTSTPAGGDLSLGATSQATIASNAWQSATVLRTTFADHRAMGTSFETILLSYTQGVNKIRSALLVDLPSFANSAVTNNSIHAPMVSIETLYASGNWTSPADLYGTTCFVELWAPGEGGQTATKGGDGGGYANKTDTIAANTAYAFTIGAVGAVGGGNGGDCTWRTNVCVAAGGGSATTQIGDVTRAQITGTSGAGNVAGGGSHGTTSAAVGAVAGEPNGSFSLGGNIVARTPGTGGGATAAAQRAGGAGLGRVTCLRAPPLTGPYVVALDEERDAAPTASRALAVSGTHAAGDAAVCLSSLTAATTPSCTESTNTLNTSSGTILHGTVFAFDCDGTDTFTVVSASVVGSFRVARIRGSAGAASVKATGATGSTSVPDSGTHTPTGGSLERLVATFACVKAVSNNNCNISAHPSGYIGMYTPQPTNSTTSSGLVSGTKRETASSYTPGAFGGTMDDWVCVTASIE